MIKKIKIWLLKIKIPSGKFCYEKCSSISSGDTFHSILNYCPYWNNGCKILGKFYASNLPSECHIKLCDIKK